MTSGLAEGNWWLINWELKLALPLGSRRSWTWETLRLLTTWPERVCEVVDETTTWGRVYLSMPCLTAPAAAQIQPDETEQVLAANAILRAQWIARFSMAEAFVAVSNELERRAGQPVTWQDNVREFCGRAGRAGDGDNANNPCL
jgi:hypothetical protein